MTRHLVTSGLVAGFIVALLATVLQFAFLERNILLAERYETGALTHFAASPDHEHSAATAARETGAEHDHDAHSHGQDDTPFWLRQVNTALTMTLTYCGYGLVMVAGMTIARHFGKTIGGAESLLWGLAGFAAFSMAPALGLEPALPGMAAADLVDRQTWWLGCAVATVAGLGLLAYGGGIGARMAGIVIMALPHVIGAPHLDELFGAVSPELAARHAAGSLGVGLVAWLTLGGLSRWLMDRTA
jgi:cobalt transporter subunit CbtA